MVIVYNMMADKQMDNMCPFSWQDRSNVNYIDQIYFTEKVTYKYSYVMY